MQATAQTTPIYAMFILDCRPASLNGGLVTVIQVLTKPDDVFMTFSIDCPTAINTDNNACRGQSIYPAEVWHTQGSVWGGTITSRLYDSITAWYCGLGSVEDQDATQ
jgi:hypothetical protein